MTSKPLPPLGRILTRLTALLAVGLLALTACGEQTGTGSDGPSIRLDGAWVLTSATVDGTDLDLDVPRPVTLTVDGTKATGQSACNMYFADLTIDGATVTFGTIGGTEMACEEPLMSLEGAYWSALARITGWSRMGETLVLTGDGVRFEFGSAPVEEPAALVGTTWTLESLLEDATASSVIARPATLVLHEDGTATGSTGCRTFRGTWTQQGDRLVFGPLATTKIACKGAAGAQDAHVLKVLHGSVPFNLDGRALTLVSSNGLGLDFRAR